MRSAANTATAGGPIRTEIGVIWRYWLALAASVALSACSERTAPEQQVRAVIAAAEQAAERRDHSALMALVSPGFEGTHGEDAREVSRLLRGYLVAHPSIDVATRVEEIDFPYEDMARVHLTVGTLGSSTGTVEVSADARAVELELQRADGAWRVTRAAWEPLLERQGTP